ncbi:MAG: hypothetical protein R3C71_03295 [Candidatus Krumholzibacteriia bacterium]|nr:hypothetical protein [bacterium]MCB9514809.1 hypothetical protein [Candidatus Latescibacterota bacterium]
MSRSNVALSLLAGVALAVLIAGVGFWFFVGPGSVQVHVSGSGAPPIRLSLPSGLLEAGLLLVPRDVYAQAAEELDDAPVAWQPVLLAACDGLANCPDGEFVRVESGADRVLVIKERRRLRIEVESGDEHVRVVLPVKSLRRCGRILAQRG